MSVVALCAMAVPDNPHARTSQNSKRRGMSQIGNARSLHRDRINAYGWLKGG